MQDHNLNDTPAAHDAYADAYAAAYTARSAAKPAAPVYVAPAPQPTIINNHYGSSNSGGGTDLLTGVLIGEALSSNHHDTYVEREVIVERPVEYRVEREPTRTYYEAPARSSTWDDTPAPSTTSSSWDDTPSKSSSWDDSSSSSSSSWSDNSSSNSSDSGGSSDW